MNSENLIPIQQLCKHYQVEIAFFNQLGEVGLIQLHTYEQSFCIHLDKIADLEKMIRLHRELDLSFEAIDVVFNLLQKVDDLQEEVIDLKNRLRLYEH